MSAMGDFNQQMQLAEARKRQQLQDEMARVQLAGAKREEQIAALPQMFATKPATMDNRDVGQGEPLDFDHQGYISRLRTLSPIAAKQYEQMMAPKPAQMQEFKPGHSYGTFNDGVPNVTYTAPEKPAEPRLPEGMQMGAKGPEWIPGYLEGRSKVASSGAHRTNLSVPINMGQKGYENEGKLRSDFKSEPIYKDYADMKTAYKQVKSALAQGNPIGDVAGATKIMKLLDPGSVVRESELGIAMAAGGRMDRLGNLVSMWMSGEKLTPQQRQEFSALADELMAAAGQSYNQKRAEYEEMGKRYQLDTRVLGDPYIETKPSPAKAASVPDLVEKYRSKNGVSR
jgi:hypothetical protein